MRSSGEALIQYDWGHHNKRKFRRADNRASHGGKNARGHSQEPAARKLRAEALEETEPAHPVHPAHPATGALRTQAPLT